MKRHIEYDDFGEFVEILDEDGCGLYVAEEPAEVFSMNRIFRKLIFMIAAMVIVFGTTSYASDVCSKHRSYAFDPYDVYEYDDPENYNYDWEDEFEDYDEAEEYWESAWDE